MQNIMGVYTAFAADYLEMDRVRKVAKQEGLIK